MLDGRVVIITGGSSGLGKALAHRLADKGAHLALIARNESRLAEAREELEQTAKPGGKVLTYSCDVVDHAEVESTMAAIVDELGPPQLLINSAGILREGHFEQLPLSTFNEVMDINYFGTLHCIKAVLPYFQKQGGGWIVNISSIGGRMGVFGYSAYCSSKYAVVGLTDTLRGELKPQGIRLQLVCPAEFDSPMVDELNMYRTAENRRLAQTMPVLDAETVADAVMKGLKDKRYLIIPGRISRMLELGGRLLPWMGRWITDAQIKKAIHHSSESNG
jgi:3-dehydrosphinganine reductase